MLFKNPSLLHDRVCHSSSDFKQADSNYYGPGFNLIFLFSSIPQISIYGTDLITCFLPKFLLVVYYLFFLSEGKSPHIEASGCMNHC